MKTKKAKVGNVFPSISVQDCLSIVFSENTVLVDYLPGKMFQLISKIVFLRGKLTFE